MGIGRIIRQALDGIAGAPVVPAPTKEDIADVKAIKAGEAVVEPKAVPGEIAPAPAPVVEQVAPAVAGQQEVVTALENKLKDDQKALEKAQQTMSATDISPQLQPAAAKEASVMISASPEAPKEGAAAAALTEEEKKKAAEGKSASAALETPAAAVEVTVPATPEPTPATDTPKAVTAFSIRFVQGTSFDNSYFVAEDGKQFLAVKASRIIPASVQNEILTALATTQEAPSNVVNPTDIVGQLNTQVDSLETFKTAMLDLENACKAENTGTAKTAGMMAWNESEVQSPKVKAGDAPVVAWMTAEAEAGMKAHPAPHQIPSKTKQFYGRLPGAAGGAPTAALNPQSALLVEKIDLLRKALEEQKAKTDMFEEKAKGAEAKVGEMEKGKEDGEHSGLMESIVKDLVAKKLIDAKGEQEAISLLSKIERKSLPQVASLLKLLGKSGMGAGGPGAAPMPPMPALGMEEKKSPFGEEKAPKASLQVPPAYVEEKGSDIASAPSFMARYWDAK